MVSSKAVWTGALVWGLAVALCLALPVPARAVDPPDTIGLFRPNAPAGNNTFFLLNKNVLAPPANTIVGFGNNGDIEVVGDWDGDGIMTIGVFRPDSPVVGTNTFFLRNTNSLGTGDITIESIGQAGDIPLVGDWDGDGTTTVGLFRPNDPPGLNTLFLWNSNTNPPGPPDITIAGIGANGDRPVVGKWTGSGDSSIGLLRPNDPAGLNTFFIWNSLPLTPPYVPDFTIAGIGADGDRPLAGDWNGDAAATIGLFRSGEPAGLNTFFLWNSIPAAPPFVPDIIVAGFGAAGLDHPVTGHWGNNPPVIDPAIRQVAENSPNGTNVGAPLTFSDPDNPEAGQTLTLSITGGNTGTTFAIDPTGQITVANNALLDFETHPTFNLTVRVTDNGNPVFFSEAPVTVNLTNVNEVPVVTTSGGTTAFTEDGGAVVVDGAVTVTDPDGGDLASATVTITNLLDAGQETLAAPTLLNGAGANYVAPTLTITGAATIAQYQTMLRAVTYNNASQNPATTNRTIAFAVNDGTLSSVASNKTVSVTAVNDVPVVTTSGGTTAFTEDGGAVVVDGAVTVTDADGGNLASASVTITNLLDAGQETLAAPTLLNGAGASYVAPTLTITGAATIAQYQAMLEAVTYNNASQNPTTTNRTIAFVVNDGTVNSAASNKTVSVIAVNDAPVGVIDRAHDVTGNVRIQVTAGSGDPKNLLNGVTDPEGNALTALVDGTSTHVGNVVINANGTYTYNPKAGRTGADVVKYKVCDNGVPSACSAVKNLTLNVSNMLWFIDNNATACTTAASGCGRLTNPYSSLAAFHAENNGTGDNPNDNQSIFIYESVNPYSAPLTLRSGQKVIGQDATNTLSDITLITPPVDSDALPGVDSGNGTIVNITSASGNTVTLGSGNTLRGFTLGNNAAGPALAGTTFGTLTLANGTSQAVDLKINNTTGQALNLNGGNIASAFHSITSSGGTNNILLTNVTTSTTTNLGSGALSGASAEALFITGQNGSFTYSGSITNTGGTQAVRIESKTGGTVTLSGNINPSVVGTAKGILVQNNSTGTNTIDFTGGEKKINTGTGTGVNLATNTGATISLTNGGLAIDTTSGTGFATTGGGTVNVSGSGNTVTTMTGTALSLNGTGGTIGLASVTTAGGNAGLVHISLTNVTGPVTITGGSLAGAGAGIRAVDISGGTANFSYGGTISNTGSASNGGGIRVTSKTGTSTVTFSGTSKTLTTGANNAVDFTGNSAGTTLTVSGGSLAINTAAGFGFNATGGGTVNVTGSSNSINSTSGTALNVTSTNIGVSHLIFQSISSGTGSNSTANGIILDTTGSSGGLHVTGTGSAGTGGTIQHKTGADASTTQGTGIYLNSTSDVQLAWMQLNDFQNFGIRGTSVTGFTLANTTINAASGQTNGTLQAEGTGEGSIRFDTLVGTVSITNSTVTHGVYDNVAIFNTNSGATALDLTVSGSTFATTTLSTTGNDAFRVQINDTVAGAPRATANITIQTSNFTAARGDLIDIITQKDVVANTAANAATVDANIIGNNFSNNHPTILSGGGGIILHGNGNAEYKVDDNDFQDARGRAVNFSKGATAGIFNVIANNNRIGLTGVSTSGSDEASGIYVDGGGVGSMTASITNNTIRRTNEAGIFVVANNQTLVSNNATLNITITGNVTAEPESLSFAGLWVDIGTGTNGDGTTACVDIGGAGALSNDFSTGDPFNSGDINLSVQAGSTMRFPGYGGADNNNGQITSYLTGRNLNAGTTAVTLSHAGTMTTSAGACTQPTD